MIKRYLESSVSGLRSRGWFGQFEPSYPSTTGLTLAILVCCLPLVLSCEVPTHLAIEGGSAPTFRLSGNGVLTSLRVRGPKKQRDILGEDASMYWAIKRKEGETGRTVSALNPIVYGEVPSGYITVYPEAAPPLQEGERYYVQVITVDAPGAAGYFSITGGKAIQDPER
jgi:hypothetical protein